MPFNKTGRFVLSGRGKKNQQQQQPKSREAELGSAVINGWVLAAPAAESAAQRLGCGGRGQSLRKRSNPPPKLIKAKQL